jgi:membrane protein YdbS with pleckstrin-like domain
VAGDNARAAAAASLLTTHRPHRDLLRAYLVRSLLTGPLILVVLPALFFRYRTLRYTFDDEGISMRWGILFRREVNVAYTRIQDIHLTSGPLLRWLGLADIHIQTAAGSAAAEMKVEGLPHYERVREFLYARMRGHAEADREAPTAGDAPAGGSDGGELIQALAQVRDELRATRIALLELSRQRADRPDR